MKILFGVFEWGMGHATRTTPLIKELLKNKNNEIHIISTDRALKVLKNNFKDSCIYYDIPGIHMIYKTRMPYTLKFSISIPRLIKSIGNARGKTEEIIKKENFDLIVSDCRFDVYDKEENSFLINHQLRFKTPLGFEKYLEKYLDSKMKKYKYVLVPDFPDENITGRLSHDLKFIKKDKIKYIGILSHIKKLNLNQDIDYFISLSGPEATRLQLEKKILTQVKDLNGKIVIAGGKPECESKECSEKLELHSFLNTEEQENIMNRAKFVVIRAGYTTIMELAELEKQKALLIPSPGQTEQVYLADFYEKMGYFHHVHQENLKLKKDIDDSMKFNGFKPPWKTSQSIKNFMSIISE